MDEGSVFGRGIAFPPRLGPDGRWAWSSGGENVRESIRIILLTETGERLMLPEFGSGIPRLLFQPNTVETRRVVEEHIRASLEQWEPRVAVERVTVTADAADPRAAIATAHYRLVATAAAGQVNLRVQLGG